MSSVEYFNQLLCSGSVTQFRTPNQEQRVRITGKIKDKSVPLDTEIYYWAANPAHRNLSSKTAIPYANPEQAFDRSPSIGKTRAINGNFSIEIEYPSAYYVGLGSVLIQPSVHVKVAGRNDLFDTIQIGEGYPYRLLTYPSDKRKNARDSPMFYYQKDLPIRSQESILRASAYPNHFKMPDNFWGLRPAR